MTLATRIDAAIARSVAMAQADPSPKRLAAALAHATGPGGARIRPTILLSVARACGDDRPDLADRAAAALELIHCASLVHDDLPCFDDAAIRRGKPSVHCAFSEPLAVLTGDALIVLAFDALAGVCDDGDAEAARRALRLSRILARRTGMPHGICAGQGWESEPVIDLGANHRSKTAALFIAATQMGAQAAGRDPEPWLELGARIGEAFQVADDLRDAFMSSAELGKPAGLDERHSRPNAVSELGRDGALARLDRILSGAIASIPSCPGEAHLARLVADQAARLVPGRTSPFVRV